MTIDLPPTSRNWINERLIYTHGYGVTMNSANGFTPEGLPQFVVSNMPIESTVPEIKITRPEIYFGQLTDRYVYVKTRQKEFDYPQGDANSTTTYEGTGGIQLGGVFRRMLLAWAVGDLSKLPFNDDVTSESRLLINRNIRGTRKRRRAVSGLRQRSIHRRKCGWAAVLDDRCFHRVVDVPIFESSSSWWQNS